MKSIFESNMNRNTGYQRIDEIFGIETFGKIRDKIGGAISDSRRVNAQRRHNSRLEQRATNWAQRAAQRRQAELMRQNPQMFVRGNYGRKMAGLNAEFTDRRIDNMEGNRENMDAEHDMYNDVTDAAPQIYDGYTANEVDQFNGVPNGGNGGGRRRSGGGTPPPPPSGGGDGGGGTPNPPPPPPSGGGDGGGGTPNPPSPPPSGGGDGGGESVQPSASNGGDVMAQIQNLPPQQQQYLIKAIQQMLAQQPKQLAAGQSPKALNPPNNSKEIDMEQGQDGTFRPAAQPEQPAAQGATKPKAKRGVNPYQEGTTEYEAWNKRSQSAKKGAQTRANKKVAPAQPTIQTQSYSPSIPSGCHPIFESNLFKGGKSAIRGITESDAETWDDFDFDHPNDPVAAADFADTFRPGEESYTQRRAREEAEWKRNHPEPARFAIDFMRKFYPDAPKSLRKMAFDKFLDALDQYGEEDLDKDKLFDLTNKVISGFMQSKGRTVFDDDGSEVDGNDILGMCGRGMHTEWEP